MAKICQYIGIEIREEMVYKFGQTEELEPCFVSLPIKYANKEARILFDKNSTDKSTFAIISIFPSDRMDDINLNQHDSVIISARVNKDSDWNDEYLKDLHQTLINKSFS